MNLGTAISLARTSNVGYLSKHTFMRKIWSLSICLFLASSSLWAQQSHTKPTGPAVSQEPKPAATAKPGTTVEAVDYSQEAFVTEHYIESFRFENDGTGREQIDVSIKVNSDAGVQALGQLKVGYSALSDKLEVVYVRVIKPDGTIVTAQDSAIQDVTYPNALMYTDYHEKHISVPSLRPGDVLEYQFVRTIVSPLTPGQFWTSYDFRDRGIVLDEQLEINVPKSRQIKLKSESGADPKITDDGDRRTYRWKHSHLEDEDDAAKKKKRPTRRHDEDEVPSVQLTTFETWQQLGDWYAGLEKDRRQPNDAIKAKATELVQGKTTNTEKVKALYDFVSRDFRYVSLSFGLGRYQPHAASEVLANGYGDCKDKNTLLAALLASQGFESTSVLIGSQHKLDPEIPSPSQFDHVITRVPVDGQEIWLDSTNGVAPFQMLAFPLRDKEALAMPPGGVPGIVRTPAGLPFVSYDRSRVEGSLNDTGKLTAHFNVVGRGDSELALRFAMRQIPNNKWKDVFEMMISRTPMKGGDITNLKVGDPANTEKPMEIDFDVAVTNYFDWSSPDPKLPLPILDVSLPPDPEDDSKTPKPIKLGAITEASTDVKIAVPAKYGVRLPIGIDVKRDYAEYHSSYKFENGQLTAVRKLQVLLTEIPYERREEYAALRRTVEADQAQNITLENKSPGTAGLGAGQSPDDLFEAAMQAGNSNNFALAIELFERLSKTDPTHKGLWNGLGGAYYSENQYQQAADAFKKQISINAYDEYAYKNLGQTYEAMQQFDDAIAQFQKQLEVNPLDPSAHASLGLLYSRLKRWNDAVPELEKAVSLQDKNPLLYVSLGEAYIASGQTEKGMSSFDRAIALSPSPVVWNNIAYSLSERNVQLDRASQYSDAAINAIETQLRDVNLDSLRLQDVGIANLLYNVWDTKGWVEFKRGNLDDAERYIRAAWEATGSGNICEHLGEIYEKRGNKDEAIHYYVLSLVGRSPSDEARPRLAALGVTGDLDSRIGKGRDEMLAMRTSKLDTSGKGTGDFFALVSPAKNDQIKFVSGDADIKTLTDAVKSTNLEVKFPNTSSVRALRRGTVTCGTIPPPPVTKTKSAAKKGSKDSRDKDKEPTPAAAAADPPTKPAFLPGPCSVELLFSNDVRSID
jgi:tetratricopeptide (TPR) repeat protein/transglutaminase-like putative cysteine protease